jgi:hypothetical protein
LNGLQVLQALPWKGLDLLKKPALAAIDDVI